MNDHLNNNAPWALAIAAHSVCGGDVNVTIHNPSEKDFVSPAMRDILDRYVQVRQQLKVAGVEFGGSYTPAMLKKYITPADHGYAMPPAWYIEAKPTPFDAYVWVKDEHRLDVAIREAEKIKRLFRYYSVRVRAN